MKIPVSVPSRTEGLKDLIPAEKSEPVYSVSMVKTDWLVSAGGASWTLILEIRVGVQR